MDFKEKLRIYAETTVKVGANVQKGQLVVIRTVTDAKELAYAIAEAAYKAGASDVEVMWMDNEMIRLKHTYASKEVLSDVREWFKEQYKDFVDRNAVFISILGSNPNLLEGIDAEKIKAGVMARSSAMSYLRSSLMSDKNSWTIVGCPNKEWAKLVFPDLDEVEGVKKLWESIFYVTRIEDENSVENWMKHIQNLEDRAKKLNDHNFKYLRYTNEKGTNLEIELPKGHLWKAARALNSKGVEFTANMPTEEVYTLPHKDGINGRVYSTKPLNYNSNIIDEFYLDFKDGKIVNFDAKKGKEILKTLIETDEGSKSLGEVALVPFDSPISNTNLMFYETLYDENASCHLAIGAAYPTCIKNGVNMNDEELENSGVNRSLTHVDFMIGDSSLNILGIKENGEEVKVFENGNWAD
jgi:hypothetical protein